MLSEKIKSCQVPNLSLQSKYSRLIKKFKSDNPAHPSHTSFLSFVNFSIPLLFIKTLLQSKEIKFTRLFKSLIDVQSEQFNSSKRVKFLISEFLILVD